MADVLREAGYRVTIAFYATRSHRPELCSSSLGLLFGRRPQTRRERAFGDHDCVAVGCVNPALEYTYSRSSGLWQELIAQHDIHIAIGGTPVIAAPLAKEPVKELRFSSIDDSVGADH